MRMMKGEEEAEVTLSAVIFVAAVGLVFGIIIMRFTDFSTAVTTSQNELESIAESHLAVGCLERSFFTSEQLGDSAAVGKCRRSRDICIWDMETGKKSEGCGGKSGWGNTVYFALKSAEGIHMGGLSVKT